MFERVWKKMPLYLVLAVPAALGCIHVLGTGWGLVAGLVARSPVGGRWPGRWPAAGSVAVGPIGGCWPDQWRVDRTVVRGTTGGQWLDRWPLAR